MKSHIRKAGLVALAGAIIGVGGYGFEKEEKLYKQTKISFVSNKNPGPAWDSYSEFGFTFKYPPELNLKAADTATPEEGSISSIKPRENGKLLHLRWMRGISGKQSIAEKVLRPYIRSREGKFYLGESKWLKVHNQQTAFSRFYTSDEKGVFLNVVYAWYVEDSNRTFVLCCGALWKHPEFVADGSRIVPRWPKLDDDPSYDFCQSVLKSFEDKLKRTFKHSERGYSLSVKGTVTKEPYPTWASLTSKRMAYLVQAEVKNTDERSFCFDCVKGAFRPDSGTPLVISTRISDANTQEPLEITLSSGQDKEWQFGTDGYTQSLLAKAGGKPLKFSLTFFLKDEVVAGPYFTTLPDIRRLPIIVGTIIVGGKKYSLEFSKSLKSAPAQIRHSSKATDGQDWIKLASLTGGEEMKQSDSFRITTGEAKIRYTLTGERAVDGELNQTSIMLYRKGLITMAEAAGKGPEGANIFPTRMVSGSGSGEYAEKVKPGTYSIYAYSPAGASWTVQVYEKRNHLEAPPKEPIVQEPEKDTTPKKSVSLQEELYKQTKIAFSSNRDGNYEIYVMNADGSEQKRLTNNPAADGLPSWSPDGKKIAFQSTRDGNGDIYIMNADGREQKRLTNNVGANANGFPCWSPDGKKIAFVLNRDTNPEIYIMNADGSEQKNMTNNPAVDRIPSWSPDGKKIAFTSDRDGIRNIYVMNADGTDQKKLTSNPGGNGFPCWSPDGRKIAFSANRNRNLEIYVMNADGTDQKRLTNNPAVDGIPSWSPDGKKIAFISNRDGNLEIYIMNADGSEQRNLTNNPVADMAPSWSPFLGSQNKHKPR